MRTIFTVAVLVGVAACSAPKTPARTTAEMLAEPAMLQEILDRCETNPARAAADVECGNAKQALAKKLAVEDAQREEKKQAEFERLRAEKRAVDDRRQQEAEAAKRPFDPYSTPVNPDAQPPKP